MAIIVFDAMLNFRPSIPHNRVATIPVETNTNSWHISDIIEQDLTLIIRVISLCFYLANPFRLVEARLN